ncbi:MAG: hypothetical protein PVH21_04605 [Myxococcales bacterium]|jgi:hypothetical protein
MSKVLTVPTHFNDIGELSEGFLDRVEQDILILYGPVAYEDGAEIEFAVLLTDGTPALQGSGRVRAAVDGGADRVPDTRYDVVVEQLQLEGRYEVVFERLLLARQAVSERPSLDDSESDEEDLSVSYDEVVSAIPAELESDEDSVSETEPPEASAADAHFDELDEAAEEDEDEDEGMEPATVIAAVDAQALMADAAEQEGEEEQETAETAFEPDSVDDPARAEAASAPPDDVESEEGAFEQTEEEPAFEGRLELDSMYAFEHGIAAEPRVGMPVPMPSMAAPPEAPPSPPVLRLANPPEGLTRPSLAQPEVLLFATDDEVSDVHRTGLFAYEDGLPIPSRPPMPDPNRPRRATPVEALELPGVEEMSADDDEYEEVRLSDFAGTAEEG